MKIKIDSSKIPGIIFILLASICWAIEPVIVNETSKWTNNYIQTNAFRALFCGLTALLYGLFTNRFSIKIENSKLKTIIIVAIIGSVAADICYYYALINIPAVNAVIIGHLQPIFIVLLGYFMLKTDKITIFDYAGILVLIIAGIIVIAKYPDNLRNLRFGGKGELIALLATLLWAIAGILMRRKIEGLNAGIITFYRFCFAFLFFIPYLLYKKLLFISSIYQIYLGILIGVGHIFYYESLKRLKAAQVAALELTAPAFAALFGLIFLNQSITLMQIAGIILLFPGVLLLSQHEIRSGE